MLHSHMEVTKNTMNEIVDKIESKLENMKNDILRKIGISWNASSEAVENESTRAVINHIDKGMIANQENMVQIINNLDRYQSATEYIQRVGQTIDRHLDKIKSKINDGITSGQEDREMIVNRIDSIGPEHIRNIMEACQSIENYGSIQCMY